MLPHIILNAADRSEYTRSEAAGSEVASALLVPPSTGRHVCFDGRWLHGAPAGYHVRQSTADSDYCRITFCVNIWVGHKPGRCARFPVSSPPTTPLRAPQLRLRARVLRPQHARRRRARHWRSMRSGRASARTLCRSSRRQQGTSSCCLQPRRLARSIRRTTYIQHERPLLLLERPCCCVATASRYESEAGRSRKTSLRMARSASGRGRCLKNANYQLKAFYSTGPHSPHELPLERRPPLPPPRQER